MPVACFPRDLARPQAGNPTLSAISSQASYRLRRLFMLHIKSHLALIPLLLLSAKSPARLACSLASALTTARCRYQLFAVFTRVQLRLSETRNIFFIAFSQRKAGHFDRNCLPSLFARKPLISGLFRVFPAPLSRTNRSHRGVLFNLSRLNALGSSEQVLQFCAGVAPVGRGLFLLSFNL